MGITVRNLIPWNIRGTVVAWTSVRCFQPTSSIETVFVLRIRHHRPGADLLLPTRTGKVPNTPFSVADTGTVPATETVQTAGTFATHMLLQTPWAPPAPSTITRNSITAWMRAFQAQLCADLEALDGTATFRRDPWDRPEGGGGQTNVLIDGALLEKAGVAFSAVWGELSAAAAKALELPARDFFATGVSVVLHPRSPWVPITHMNVRYFEADGGRRAWFGGGADLTPIYVDAAEARAYHEHLRAAVEVTHPGAYPRFRDWADQYFTLPHRQETRGVGGLFADRLGADAASREEIESWFPLINGIAGAFFPAWAAIAAANRARPYGERELAWQRLRRGRYAEFNLAVDRGTRFGLETGGRTESILMSLPPLASWTYDYQPEAGSLEAQTQAWLRPGVQWL